MIYLDSSALLKLVRVEAESGSLRRWLSERDEVPRVSSELATAEVLRAARRVSPVAVSTARDVLDGLDRTPLSKSLMVSSADVGDPHLRTLDAIHVASALTLRPHLEFFVAYDRRLLEAASEAGMITAAPGQ